QFEVGQVFRTGCSAVRADGRPFNRVRPLGPARAADLRDVEGLGHLPAEAGVHACVVVPALTDGHEAAPYDGWQCTKSSDSPAASMSRYATSPTTCWSGASPHRERF